MSLNLDGRVALVTGAGSGIGAATAKLFASRGASVAALDVDTGDLADLASEIEAAGGRVRTASADVSDPGGVRAAVQAVVGEWGRLDIVFANAGINGVWAPIEELEPDEWLNTLNINLFGTFLTVKYAVPHLKKNGGCIVITSSVNGTRIFSNTGATAYSASKAGQLAFAKMIALELAPHGVRVNVVCPGAIDTDIGENTETRHLEHIRIPVEMPAGDIPLTGGDPGSPEQVAELVAFLVSDTAAHISGTEIYIDGAGSLLRG